LTGHRGWRVRRRGSRPAGRERGPLTEEM
jgi:hypothetical protein